MLEQGAQPAVRGVFVDALVPDDTTAIEGQLHGGFRDVEAERRRERQERRGARHHEITPDLHVLVEVKAHRYGVEDRFGGQLEYTSFTVGPGVFWDFYVYEDLFVQPNLRWWPTVASTYDGQGRLRAADGSEVRHQRHDLLPFANVNLGWTFSGR